MDIDVPSPHVDQVCVVRTSGVGNQCLCSYCFGRVIGGRSEGNDDVLQELQFCPQGDNQAPHDEALASSNSTLPPQESQPADPAAPHRLRFSDAKFRTSDAIHDVWEKYKEPVDGVSFRSLDENNAGWSNRAKWTDRPAYQAYLKWSLITERIKVYALAIAAALGIGAQEAEQKAVQVLQYERYIANVSLSTFRQQALKKEATGGLRTRNPQELGLELQATLQKLENLEKSAHKKVAAL